MPGPAGQLRVPEAVDQHDDRPAGGSEPEVRIVVDVGSSVLLRLDTAAVAGAARLAGRAVDLIEGLSFRTPLTAHVATTDRWLLSGLDTAFDVA